MKQICNVIIFSVNPCHCEIFHSGYKVSKSISDAKNPRKSDQVIAVYISFYWKKKNKDTSSAFAQGKVCYIAMAFEFLFVFCWQFGWFWQHLLSTYCVPGTVLDPGDIKMNKTWFLSPRSLQSLVGKQVVQRHSVCSKMDKKCQ